MTNNKIIGNIGEELAAETLRAKGHYILRRNFTCPYGEIDIITIKNKVISFVEVKTRASSQYGSPIEAVNITKQKRIRNAAQNFLYQYKKNYEQIDFKVIEITVNQVDNLEF